MKQLAILEYNFFFEPSTETWTNLYQFEQSFAKYLLSCGLEAEVIKSIEGGISKRFMYIKKTPVSIPDPKNAVGRPASLKTYVGSFSKKTVKAPERDFKTTHQLKVIK